MGQGPPGPGAVLFGILDPQAGEQRLAGPVEGLLDLAGKGRLPPWAQATGSSLLTGGGVSRQGGVPTGFASLIWGRSRFLRGSVLGDSGGLISL